MTDVVRQGVLEVSSSASKAACAPLVAKDVTSTYTVLTGRTKSAQVSSYHVNY